MVTLFIFLLENSSAAFILWLGIFIITLTLSKIDESFYWPESPPLFAGIATTLLAIYLFGVAMQAIVHTPAEFVLWQKLTWCTTPVAVLAFFWSTLLLVFQLQIRALSFWQRLFFVSLALYALFLIIGIATGFFMQYAAIQPQATPFQTFYAPARLPHFYFYNLFVAVLLISCVTLFLRQWWCALQINADEYQRYKWLGYGSLCLLIGALIGAAVHPLSNGKVPKQLGDYILTLGAGAVSYGIARHNALAHGEIIEQDFWHSLLSVTQTAAFYLLTFYGIFWIASTPIPALATPLLLAFAIITQTSFQWNDSLLDRLLLPQWAIGYRESLVLLRNTLLTAKQPEKILDQSETTFQQIIETVRQEKIEELISQEIDNLFQYRRLQNDKILADSPLQNLVVVQQALLRDTQKQRLDDEPLTAGQRAHILRHFLIDLLEQQGADMPTANSTQPLTETQIEYLILHKKYVEQRSQSEIEQYLYQTHALLLTGGSYSRRLTQARQRFAQILCNREMLARKQSADEQ